MWEWYPLLCLGVSPPSRPDSWVALGVLRKEHTVTSCVLLCPLSHCVQSTKFLSRWLYLILVHLNSFSGCLATLCTVASGCRSKVGSEHCIPTCQVLWAFHASCCPVHGYSSQALCPIVWVPTSWLCFLTNLWHCL